MVQHEHPKNVDRFWEKLPIQLIEYRNERDDHRSHKVILLEIHLIIVMKFWGVNLQWFKMLYDCQVIISSFKLLLLLTVAGLVSLHNEPSHKLKP